MIFRAKRVARTAAALAGVLLVAAAAASPQPSPTSTGAPGSASPPTVGTVVSVKDFGAVGDGITNDTDAFAAASKKLTSLGGGTLWIPPGTYIVGKQTFTKGHGYVPSPIIAVSNCQNPVVIRGNGATLRATDGLRYGAFDPATGERYDPPSMPFLKHGYAAAAYKMIDLNRNASVEVSDLELDGNLSNLVLGGTFGDTGRQIPAVGIIAYGNKRLTIKNIYTHHHGLDGILIGNPRLTEASDPVPVVLDNVNSEFNARQGLSFVGGIGLTVTNSKFDNTGRARFSSAPGAGVDLEAENSIIRNVTFINCEFGNNKGVGLVADSGNSAHITIKKSRFWGTTTWALWPQKPYVRIEDSEIHGPIVHAWGSTTNPAEATQFVRTTFDDIGSPEFGPVSRHNVYLIDFGAGHVENVTFDNCTITNKNRKGMYISGARKAPLVIKNSTIVHANGSLPAGDFQDVLRGVLFDNVHFAEAFAPPPPKPGYYYSSVQGAEVVGTGNLITGGHVRILGRTSGIIPPGLYGYK